MLISEQEISPIFSKGILESGIKEWNLEIALKRNEGLSEEYKKGGEYSGREAGEIGKREYDEYDLGLVWKNT